MISNTIILALICAVVYADHVQEGGACTYDGLCAGSMVCIAGTCGEPYSRLTGEGCASNSHCAGSLICIVGTCGATYSR